MKIEFTKSNEVLNIAIDGRLDTITAPELEKFISEYGSDVNMITIDCE